MVVVCTAWHEVEREMTRANREGNFHYVLSDTVDYSELVIQVTICFLVMQIIIIIIISDAC